MTLIDSYVDMTIEFAACAGAIAGVAYTCRSEVWTADEKVERILRDIDALYAKYPACVEAPDE